MSQPFSESDIAELRRAVSHTVDGAYLVEPRVVRRLIRELQGFARLSTRIPHTESQIVSASDVRTLTHPDELGLESFTSLPEYVLLIAQPEDHDVQTDTMQDLLQFVWRRLFHGVIDRHLRQRVRSHQLNRPQVESRIAQIGQVEFDEAHAVFRNELRLIEPDSRVEAYTEFAAVYLELSRFAPDQIAVWFPSVGDRTDITSILTQDVDADQVYRTSRLYGAPDPDLTPGVMKDEARLSSERQNWTTTDSLRPPSTRRYVRLMRRHDRARDRGNSVAAGVAAMRAAECATGKDDRDRARQAALEDMGQLSRRLQQALNFSDDDRELWTQSLSELLHNATQGFWNADKKLLYDLQNVCLDHERVTYRVDLVKWIVSRGKRSLRRPLTSIREVMMAKHLASSASRLAYVRLSGKERRQLASLIHNATDLAEEQMRERMRPAIQGTLKQVGLAPRSVPEQVAFDKLTEESLDCIAERGYLTMGYLRDAISRNDLKLPDLTDPKDLIRGDHLLRSDDRLDVALDGVYRRGEFYLRWLQVISSIAFGTRAGRFATLFLIIPFGGAKVIVDGIHHLADVFTGDSNDTEVVESADDAEATETLDETTADNEAETDASAEPPGLTTESSDDLTDQQETTASEPLDETDTAATANDTPEAEAEAADPASTVEADFEGTEQIQVAQQSSPEFSDPADIHFSTLPHVIVIGFLLMAIIHLPAFRGFLKSLLSLTWKTARLLAYQIPTTILGIPAVQWLMRNRLVIKVRRYVVSPLLVAWIGCQVVPWATGHRPLSGWWVAAVASLLSAVANSRLGRDAEELTAEWLSNVWYDLQARVVMAVFEWIVDFFKWVLSVVERFIYAVDEWLRFHSGETIITIILKACLGVVWSLVVFLIRIYLNLMIEPQVNPIKHFPVVTVAHKIMLPFFPYITKRVLPFMEPLLGEVMSNFVIGATLFLLPGVFGFLVWELKENWRLYATNRVPVLRPVAIGAHGETAARLMKPGFHSGTLPKLFNRIRRLERKEASFQRFSTRRALREKLQMCERDIKRFVERDLLAVFRYCRVWQDYHPECTLVHAASNSVLIRVECREVGEESLTLLFQEQSGWFVATIQHPGWLERIPPELLHSFETALLGFYRKAGVELVREQLERRLVGRHTYDICAEGLIIWPEGQFDKDIVVDLQRRHQVRPTPITAASAYGITATPRESVVFAQSEVLWTEWQQLWLEPVDESAKPGRPLACLQSARLSLIPAERSRDQSPSSLT